jgi:hypothetical protein
VNDNAPTFHISGTPGCVIPAVALVLVAIAAWGTHVVVCIKAGSWGLLIAGAIWAPVAVVHGVGIWFGVW